MQAGYAVAAIVCAKFGYDFGIQIGGTPVGFVVAANGALFGWLMAGAAADQVLRLFRWWRPPP